MSLIATPQIAVLGVLTAETNYADLQPVDNVTVTDEVRQYLTNCS